MSFGKAFSTALRYVPVKALDLTPDPAAAARNERERAKARERLSCMAVAMRVGAPISPPPFMLRGK